MATSGTDPRLEQLVELVMELAEGRFAARMQRSPVSDDIDAVITGVHMLAEELGALYDELETRVVDRTEQLASAHQQLEHKVLHDPLTGLANRVGLLDQIGRAIAKPWRSTERVVVVVVVIDLDGFKAINDSFGHAVGDELLVEVGRRLRRAVREDDTVARLGGDEFALVVDGASVMEGLAVADRVVRRSTPPSRRVVRRAGSPPASGCACPPLTTPRRTCCSATPTRPCMGPKRLAEAAYESMRQRCAPRHC